MAQRTRRPRNPASDRVLWGEEWNDEMEADMFDRYGGLYPQQDFTGHDYANYPANVFEELAERHSVTPDFYKFRDLEEVPLFVYDSMKEGGSRHNFIKNSSNYYGEAHTIQTSWRLYSCSNRRNEYPAFFQPKDKETYGAALRGEVYGVASETLVDLDNFYENGRKFRRRKMLVVAENQAPVANKQYRWKNKAVIPCYLYEALPGLSWDNAGLLSKGRVSHHHENVPAHIRGVQFYEVNIAQINAARLDDRIPF